MTSATIGQIRKLKQLSHLYGVQTTYYDMARQRQWASPEALLHVLRALGAPVETLRNVPAAIRERRQALWQRYVEPVIVAWNRRPVELELRRPTDTHSPLLCHLQTEAGEARSWTCELGQLSTVATAEVEGVRYEAHRLILPFSLPPGYHRLALEMDGRHIETLIISSPLKAYTLPASQAGRAWGVFLPLYALASPSWGAGDLGGLEALMKWVATLGGSIVATLPLLAAFLDEPFGFSPYSSASRLFWNEFYLDVTRIPELERCQTAQALLDSAEVLQELEALRAAPLVDYRRQMALKRRVLEELSRYFFTEKPRGYATFRRFVEAHPAAEDYARFRATGERQRTAWPFWPERLRDGSLVLGDYDENAAHYHLYVQWLADEQLQALSRRARAFGTTLYLDLPLSVPLDSYDVWRERDAFAQGVSAGAPPDNFFTKGQNWGLLPLHPERIREQGYRYFIACLRHHLKYAGLLRLDHVMSLHRLFWVPRGLEARQGVYVRYRADELYAILSLESHRHQSAIVGENLGTVPSYVNRTMARHNILGTYVGQFGFTANPEGALRAPPPNSVASLNTHDTPTFAGFWQSMDIEYRLKKGLMDENSAQMERRYREELRWALTAFLERQGWLKGDPANLLNLLRACLAYLGASPAPILLVNLEDLWLDIHQQNIPGSSQENPNWQRKARYSLDTFCIMPEILDILKEIDQLRKVRPR